MAELFQSFGKKDGNCGLPTAMFTKNMKNTITIMLEPPLVSCVRSKPLECAWKRISLGFGDPLPCSWKGLQKSSLLISDRCN